MQLIINEGGGEVDQEHASLLASHSYAAMTYFFNIGEAQGLISFKEGYPDAFEGRAYVFFVRTSSSREDSSSGGFPAVTVKSKYSLHIISLGETAPALGPDIINDACIYNAAAANEPNNIVLPEEFEFASCFLLGSSNPTTFGEAPDIPALIDLPSPTYAYSPNSHIFIQGSAEVEFTL